MTIDADADASALIQPKSFLNSQEMLVKLWQTLTGFANPAEVYQHLPSLSNYI